MVAAATCGADTLYVPGDYPTIQAAIDAASDGDEILVAPGTYHERPVIRHKNLILRGQGGSEQTIVDAGYGGRAFEATDAATLTVEGFKIQNGRAELSAGVDIARIQVVVLRDLVITRNSATRAGGGGSINCDDLLMEDCAIDFNSAVPPWDDDFPMAFTGGCSIGAAHLSVRRCRFSRNHATYGGGVSISTGEMDIVDSTFEMNRSEDPDWYDELGLGTISGAGTLRNCMFSSNSSSRTCMELRGGNGPLSFVECGFESNSAASPSADLIVLGGDVRFESCRFIENYADYALISGPARVLGSVFDNNYAVRGMLEGGAVVDGCYFARNSPCFYITDESLTHIQNSIFCNNPGGIVERHSDGAVLVTSCVFNRNGWILTNFGDSAVGFEQNEFCGTREAEFWGPWNDLGGNSFCDRDLPDFNGDGVVDTSDVTDFQNAWAVRDPAADADANGRIDSRDWIAFLNAWANDEC